MQIFAPPPPLPRVSHSVSTLSLCWLLNHRDHLILFSWYTSLLIESREIYTRFLLCIQSSLVAVHLLLAVTFFPHKSLSIHAPPAPLILTIICFLPDGLIPRVGLISAIYGSFSFVFRPLSSFPSAIPCSPSPCCISFMPGRQTSYRLLVSVFSRTSCYPSRYCWN